MNSHRTANDGAASRLVRSLLRVGFCLSLGLSWHSVQAQLPNLKEGGEIWRGERDGIPLRLWHLPRRPATLLPIRFGLEELPPDAGHPNPKGEPMPTSGLVSRLDRVQIQAVGGAAALRSYRPREERVVFWHDGLSEVRETFRAPGIYRLRFSGDDSGTPAVEALLEVAEHKYLPFGLEMAAFIAGCLILGAFLLVIVLGLHRRSRKPHHANPTEVPRS